MSKHSALAVLKNAADLFRNTKNNSEKPLKANSSLILPIQNIRSGKEPAFYNKYFFEFLLTKSLRQKISYCFNH